MKQHHGTDKLPAVSVPGPKLGREPLEVGRGQMREGAVGEGNGLVLRVTGRHEGILRRMIIPVS